MAVTTTNATIKGQTTLGIFNPLFIAGCQLWLDAADSSTVTLSSGKVSQWNDKSLNAFNVSQSNASYQPTYSNTQNSNSVITFDRTNSTSLTRTTPTTLLQNLSGYTIFSVGNTTSTTQNQNLYWISRDVSSSIRSSFGFDSSNVLTVTARKTDTDIQNISASTAWGTGYGVFSFTLNYSTTTATIYGNGSLRASTSSFLTSGTSANTNSQYLTIGAYFNGISDTSFNLTGNVAEIIIYNTALSNAQRIQVENYLRTKWGTG